MIIKECRPVDTDSRIEMHEIEIELKDKTKVMFVPGKEQNISKWQQALAIVNNMKRMG